jgi:hypothetical protein
VNNVKRMGDETSALAATGASRATGVPAIPAIDETASATHPHASLLDNERDIPTPCQRGIDSMLRIFCGGLLLGGANHFASR